MRTAQVEELPFEIHWCRLELIVVFLTYDDLG